MDERGGHDRSRRSRRRCARRPAVGAERFIVAASGRTVDAIKNHHSAVLVPLRPKVKMICDALQ